MEKIPSNSSKTKEFARLANGAETSFDSAIPQSEFHAPMVAYRRKNFLFRNGKAEFCPFQRIFLNFFHFFLDLGLTCCGGKLKMKQLLFRKQSFLCLKTMKTLSVSSASGQAGKRASGQAGPSL